MRHSDAEPAAEALVDATCRGIGTHGVFRLRQYVRELSEGCYNFAPNVTVAQRTSVSAVVDADGGLGYRPGMLAAELAADIATSSGIAAVAVRNSHHLGAAGHYVRRTADAGLIAFMTTTTSPTLAPPNGSRPVVGNNPVAYGFPRGPGREPMIVDLALSLVARGHIRAAASRGESVPKGWGFDKNGESADDPVTILDGGFLAP